MNDNLRFLSEKVRELDAIMKQLVEKFPEKSFTLDGILIGNIIELIVSEIYGITLYKQSKKVYDGYVGNKQIQIKGTQGNGSIVIRHEPAYLIVVFLDREKGKIQEIYNGLGKPVWDMCKYIPSMNHYTIRVIQLLELNKHNAPEDRIKNLLPIENYHKISNIYSQNKEKRNRSNNSNSNKGQTTITGYINKHKQENIGCLNKPGTHMNQIAYKMKCHNCGQEYESNGCDIFLRRCPYCM